MVKLFIQSIKLSIKSQIEYKGSFILNPKSFKYPDSDKFNKSEKKKYAFIFRRNFRFNRKKYANQVYYLVGNALNKTDLKRSRTDNSICVIILADKLTTNHRKEDFNNIMKAFSIKNYSNMICGQPLTRVYIQLILPKTKEMYYNSLIQKNEYEQGPQIICLEEIKLQMLGKSCQCQGINTIIETLTTS